MYCHNSIFKLKNEQQQKKKISIVYVEYVLTLTVFIGAIATVCFFVVGHFVIVVGIVEDKMFIKEATSLENVKVHWSKLGGVKKKT